MCSLFSDGNIKNASPFPDNFECSREEKEIEDLMEYKNSLACELFSMNVKNTTMSKKNAFVIPSIMAPITKKNNLNTEHKKLTYSYYEKEITFDYHEVAEAFISEEISIQSITSGSISDEKVKKIFKKACVLKDVSISAMKQALVSAFKVILAGESECHQVSIYFLGTC